MNNIIIKDIIDDICKKDKIMNEIIINSKHEYMNNKQNKFSYLIGLIIGQKIRFKDARIIRQRLYIEIKNNDFNPIDILNLTDEQWKKINIEQNKKETIITISKYLYDNKQNIENMSNQELLSLQKIKGVGNWTITTFMIEYGLNLDIFPLNDKYVNNQLKKYYNIKTKEEIVNFINLFTPYKSIIFWYLWKNNI